MRNFESKQELIDKHLSLIGLKPVHFEVEDNKKSLIFVRFSNGEVGICHNTLDYCKNTLNLPIYCVGLRNDKVLDEWVVAISSTPLVKGEPALNIITGIPNSVKME